MDPPLCAALYAFNTTGHTGVGGASKAEARDAEAWFEHPTRRIDTDMETRKI